ncbi:hypothetical protein HOH45_08930 [bacterium]|jgi:hypothetical protein|nr:hypothetical protein [bacterium]
MKKYVLILIIGINISPCLIYGQFGEVGLEVQRQAIQQYNIEKSDKTVKQIRAGEYIVKPDPNKEAISKKDAEKKPKGGLSFGQFAKRIKKKTPETPTRNTVKKLKGTFRGMSYRIKKRNRQKRDTWN